MPNKKKGVTQNAAPTHGRAADKKFRQRVWSATQRAIALAFLGLLHQYVVDPVVAGMFTEGTVLASAAHGFSILFFFGAYIRLGYEMLMCFWD